MIVHSGANLSLYAGRAVVVHNGFSVQDGGKLRIDACAQDLCVTGTTGTPLRSGCHPCVTQICATDPYCCTTDWDEICVAEVGSICDLVCP